MATPWDGVKKYFGNTKISAVTGEDGDRIRAYEVYENFYWNTPDTFKLVLRGDNAIPVYLLGSRRVIESTQRFLAVNWDYVVDPQVGTAGDQQVVVGYLRKLFARERLYAKFVSQKRNMLIRGDVFWHITGDPAKPPGSRLSVFTLNASNVFPIVDRNDETRVLGYHIVSTVVHPDNDQLYASQRQTYRKTEDGVESSLSVFELGRWDDRPLRAEVRLVRTLIPAFRLPVDVLPVYHIRNQAGEGLWGSSELRGTETILAAMNQTVSDQDLTLAIHGLGVYVTDSGPAVNPDGSEATVDIGPARIIEVAQGAKFDRVTGVTTGLPGIEHMSFLGSDLSSGVGVPDVAAGKVDVTVAESGISLYLQMAPLLSRNAEKEQEILGVMDNMLYDIVHQWLPVYEQITVDDVNVVSVVSDPMPQNRESRISEIISLFTAIPPLITVEMAQTELAKLGYEFPAGSAEQILEQAREIDPFANRFNVELGLDAVANEGAGAGPTVDTGARNGVSA